MVFDPLEGLIDINDPDRIKMLPMGWRPKPVGRAEASKIVVSTKEDALKIFNMTGKEGKNKNKKVRIVKDKKTLDETWKTLTKNATKIEPKVDSYGEKIERMQLDDGTILQYRLKSKSIGETIEIGKKKIHIEHTE